MPGYRPHPEFINYNEVIVEIDGYRISNVNTAGIPSNQCGAHLQSFTITGAAYEADSTSSLGCKGSLSIIDYKYAVFNLLVNHWKKYNSGNSNSANNNVNAIKGNAAGQDSKVGLFPSIKLTINCFTGKRDWSGVITKWEMSFTGGAPRIDIEWGVYSVANQDARKIEIQKRSYNTPEAMLDYIQNGCGLTADVDFVFSFRGNIYTNKEISGKLKFNKSSVELDPSKFDSGLDILRGAYYFMCQNMVTADGGNALQCSMDDGDKFICKSKDPNDNKEEANDETQPINNLVFVQNGNYTPYSTVICGAEGKSNSERYVIPIMSLNFKTDFTKIPLQPKITDNINGATVVGNNGCSSTNNATATKDKISGDSTANNNSQINISFECYNVACFSTNNTALQPMIKVFDEFGNEVSYLGGTTTVTGVSYSLDGAVIKASVECTTVFGSNSAEIKEGVKVVSEDDDTKEDTVSSKEEKEHQEQPSDLKKYLCSEDINPISLSMDKTAVCLNNGLFSDHVSEFLATYGDLSGSAKLLDIEFINKLVSARNFGLLALLIAVGNYGIKNPPSHWGVSPYIDAVSLYKNFKPFCASSTGKSPYDYMKGGLGIAHWDSGNLVDIYETIGFSPTLSKDDRLHFENLLCTEGRVTWSTITFSGISRIAPNFSKKSSVTLFDKGLRQDSLWKDWARDILYYKSADGIGSPIYQHYLFELWIKKFWVPTIASLNNAKPSKDHTVCLQDAIRISRAGNSVKSLIHMSAGKSVEEQYDIYYGDKDRYVRQKAFCRRCADIVSWIITYPS